MKKYFKKIQFNKKKQLDKNVFIFLFFFIISTVFWFINALDNEYTTKIMQPVRFVNFPEDKIIHGDLPSVFVLTVKGRGFDIWKHQASFSKTSLVIDLKKKSFSKIEEENRFYFLTYGYKSKIEEQINSRLELLSVSPDSIYVDLVAIVNKKVPVILSGMLEYEKQYTCIDPIRIMPDSVEISGPSSLIDTVTAVYTEDFVLKKISNAITFESNLMVENDCVLKTTKVKIHVPVEKYTEASFKISIECINQPDSIELKIFPAQLKVSYFVSLAEYHKIDKKQFKAIVDFSEKRIQKGKMQVKLVTYPDKIINLDYFPRRVDFIIEK